MATDFIQGTPFPGRPGTKSYRGGYSLDNTIPKTEVRKKGQWIHATPYDVFFGGANTNRGLSNER